MITKVEDLFVPEVLAQEVEQKLVDMLVTDQMTETDTTLQGKAGDTITLPSFNYIGDAEDVAEGEAIPVAKLESKTRTATIKKYGKGVPVTDEAALSGYGDPIGVATTQLAQSLKQKMDKDTKAMLSTDVKAGMTVGSSSEVLDDKLISKALVKYGEDIDGAMVMAIDPLQLKTLRDNDFYIPASEIAADIRVTGAVGSIHGVQFIVRNLATVANGSDAVENFLSKAKPVKNLIKREAFIEIDRNKQKQITTIYASTIGGTFLYDESKVVKLVSTKPAAIV